MYFDGPKKYVYGLGESAPVQPDGPDVCVLVMEYVLPGMGAPPLSYDHQYQDPWQKSPDNGSAATLSDH